MVRRGHGRPGPFGKTLAGRDDITAIIGPFGNDAVESFAPACKVAHKPLIVPTATSEEIQRRYAVKKVKNYESAKPFLWALTENDATLTETMMSSFAIFSEYWDNTDNSCYFFSPTSTRRADLRILGALLCREL